MFDSLTEGRIEIDQIETRGDAFAGSDMREIHAALAREGHAEAVTLNAEGAAIAANEFLYKRAVVIAPEPTDPRDALSREAIAACVEALRGEVSADTEVKDVIDARLVVVEPGSRGLAAGNGAAIVTRHRPLYRATGFVRRYTQAPLRFAIPLQELIRIFDAARYQHLDGRLLEGVARLFGADVRVLAYPCEREHLQSLLDADPGRGWTLDDNGPWSTADQLRPPPPQRHLYEYLLASRFLVPMPAR